MSGEADPEFAALAERIHANVSRQGFMNLVGAELSELSRGTCTIAVERRPELLQQHGFFHGGDQLGQPQPTACLASPNLGLPVWPHCLPRLHGRGQSPARLPVPCIPPKESGEM